MSHQGWISSLRLSVCMHDTTNTPRTEKARICRVRCCSVFTLAVSAKLFLQAQTLTWLSHWSYCAAGRGEMSSFNSGGQKLMTPLLVLTLLVFSTLLQIGVLCIYLFPLGCVLSFLGSYAQQMSTHSSTVSRHQTHLLLPKPLLWPPLLTFVPLFPVSSHFSRRMPPLLCHLHLPARLCRACIHVEKQVCMQWVGRGGRRSCFCNLMGCRETWLSTWSCERRSLWGVTPDKGDIYTLTLDHWSKRRSRQLRSFIFHTADNPQLLHYFFFVCFGITLGRVGAAKERDRMRLSAVWIPFWAEECLCGSSSYYLQPVVCRSSWVSAVCLGWKSGAATKNSSALSFTPWGVAIVTPQLRKQTARLFSLQTSAVTNCKLCFLRVFDSHSYYSLLWGLGLVFCIYFSVFMSFLKGRTRKWKGKM